MLTIRNPAGAPGRCRTVNRNTLLTLAVPSLTVIVMLALPVCPGCGVIVTVRLPAVPPNTMPETGTRVGLPELPETVRLDAAVSGSLMLNGIAAVDVLAAITRLVMTEIVGDWLTLLTVTVNARETMLLLAPPSLTVTVMVAEPDAEATRVNLREPVALGLV